MIPALRVPWVKLLVVLRLEPYGTWDGFSRKLLGFNRIAGFMRIFEDLSGFNHGYQILSYHS